MSSNRSAWGLRDAPVILSHERLKEFWAQLGQAFQRTGLVTAHQGGVADHIGGKNCGKPTFHAHSPSIRRLTAIDQRIHAAEKALECPLVAISGHVEG